ncbi:helix-turn-helix domain-containing protein [Kitasatospora phosalacinea]|uniref:Helix-turn-helix domain-containing protein n=1 Tax=Kitasatospora phosalacinea TaxID=2065 RepID=A0ABW6GWM2_9ACTN
MPAGPRRRVPGLRRSEVAALADVSPEYYARLEREHLGGASAAVLEAVARALRLDDAERSHLFHLARAADGSDLLTRAFHPDWDLHADITVAILRTEAGRNPHDRHLHDLVGELSTRSDEFRTRWGVHDVRHHGTGTKHFTHPAVGDLTLTYEGLRLTADPDLVLTVYTAEPGSPSEERLRLFVSWGATREAVGEGARN